MTQRRTWPAAAALVAALTLTAGQVVPASGSVARQSAACTQPARQQSIPAPTGTPWYATRLGRDHVAGLSLGDGQVVAVLDTGVAPVPALAAALRPAIDLLPTAGSAESAGSTESAAAAASTAQDCDGRGTLLAGLVAARRAPGLELPGLARAASILPIRILASAGDTADPVVLAAGMTAAVKAGATVLLVGSAIRDDPALQQATQAALVAGVPVVAAAGDGGDPSAAFPAAYDGVIGVAATGAQDAPSVVNAAGKVSVGAPGVDVVGLGLDGGVVGGQAGSVLAAATVADVRTAIPGLRPEQLRNRIRNTADRPGTAVPDPSLGWGVVNPVTALTAPRDPTVSTGAPDAQSTPGPSTPGPSTPAQSRPAQSPAAQSPAAQSTGVQSAPAPTSRPARAPEAVVVALPPEPADNSWAIAAAAMLLSLAAIAAAVVAGVRRAKTRKWRPAAEIDAGSRDLSPNSTPSRTDNLPQFHE